MQYANESVDISKEWRYPNTNTDFLIIGIDEATYNIFQNQSYGKILNLTASYEELAQNFVITNFGGDLKSILSELRLEIYTDAESSTDQSASVYLDFFNSETNRTSPSPNTWIAKEDANLTIFSQFNILNIPLFYSMIGMNNPRDSSPILLCGTSLLERFEAVPDEEIYPYKKRISLNLRIDRTLLLSQTPSKTMSQLQDTFKPQALLYRNDLDINFTRFEMTSLEIILTTLENDIFNARFYNFLIFIPIFIFGGLFVNLTFSLFIERRREEFRLYLINGLDQQTLKKILWGTSTGLGIIGGILSSQCGLLLSKILGTYFFPEVTFILLTLKTSFWSFFVQNIFFYALLGGCFGFVAIGNSIKHLKLENLTSFLGNSASQNTKWVQRWNKGKIIILWTIFSLILFAWVLQITGFPINVDLIQETNFQFVSYILLWLGPVLGIAPFCFPLLLTNSVLDKMSQWIIKQKTKISSQNHSDIAKTQEEGPKKHLKSPTNFHPKRIQTKKNPMKKLLIWNMDHNWSKNTKIIKIYTFALVLITLSSNLVTSYQYSKNIHFSLYTAQSEVIEMELFEDVSLSTLPNISQALTYETNFGSVDHINMVYHSQINDERYSTENYEGWEVKIHSLDTSDLEPYRFSFLNYAQLMHDTTILDEWFIGGTFAEICSQMEQPDSVLVPTYMFDQGLNINDIFSFSIKLENGTMIRKNGRIIGAYDKFPASFLDRDFMGVKNVEIFMSYDLLKDGCVKSVQMFLYGEKPLENQEKQNFIEFLANVVKIDCNIEEKEPPYDIFEFQTFRLFQLESYFFIGFALIGFLLFYKVEKIQTGKNMAILRSKGILEREMWKIHLQESGLVFCTIIFLSLIGLASSPTLLVFLNYYRSETASYRHFELLFQTNWALYPLILFLGGFFFFLLNSGFFYKQIKSTRQNSRLDQYLRAS
ncbi:hypothetical protein NEF87_001872 [Candidatus Lokiarchaeum ossiferum]|uniref:ABC3 transporter permease protein domain-containing protein n=1 Tax=Candidatus Lokiarchaeum ossiferum TaxID=2951803 RepID=A0ABY6HQ09_9ARCH|nr:hypothetical protein NEF87_001872 [Candidatus Lokiarchaeum sp. B-35]